MFERIGSGPGTARGPRPRPRANPPRAIGAATALVLVASTIGLGGCVGEGGADAATRPVPAVPIATVPLPSSAASAAFEVVPDAIPPGLAGRTWVVETADGSLVAGVTGSGRRVRFPAGERILAIGPGRIATARPASSGWSVRVVSLTDGVEVAAAAPDDEPLSAAFIPGRLVIGGHRRGTSGRDPGLVAIELTTGTATTLLAPRERVGREADLARSVSATPDGRIVSALCGLDGCAIDLVDPAAGTTRRLAELAPAWPGPVTDTTVLVGEAESAWISGLELRTGTRRWTRSDGEFQHAYPTADGRIVQALIGEDLSFRIELLDAATGSGRVVFERSGTEGLVLWPELSNDRYAVVSTSGNLADAAVASHLVRAGVVDLATGEYVPAGIELELGR
jgi:hypothetical protein